MKDCKRFHFAPFFLKKRYFGVCCPTVVLGGELAVPFTRNPLHAGLNSRFRASNGNLRIVLIGRHATDGHEPRQVRKEAAISDADCVVGRSRSVWWFMLSREVRKWVHNHLFSFYTNDSYRPHEYQNPFGLKTNRQWFHCRLNLSDNRYHIDWFWVCLPSVSLYSKTNYSV